MNRFERHPRSSIMLNLVGSVQLAPNFPMQLLPPILQHLQVYSIIDRSHRSIHPNLSTHETLQREQPPAIDDISRHYVVKRLVDQRLGISIKTIDNYFRKQEDDTISIGYVLHSNRIPRETRDFLSPSNHYLLIRIDYLKEWYTHSLIVMNLIRRKKAQRWIIHPIPPNTSNEPTTDNEANEANETNEANPVQHISTSASSSSSSSSV